MSKINIDTNRLIFVIIVLFDILTLCSANRDPLIFPINSNLKNTSAPDIYEDNHFSINQTNRVNNKTEVVYDTDDNNNNNASTYLEETQRRQNEETRKMQEKIKTINHDSEKGEGGVFLTLILVLIGIGLAVVAVPFIISTLLLSSAHSNRRNGVNVNQTSNSTSRTHQLRSVPLPHIHIEDRRFMPSAPAHDNPPPYVDVQELATPTGPPPSYSAWIESDHKNDSQFSRTINSL